MSSQLKPEKTEVSHRTLLFSAPRDLQRGIPTWWPNIKAMLAL